MIDWDLQDTPLALDIYKSDEVVMALFGLKNLQDYEHEIQYNEEAYFGSQVNSLSHKSEKEKKNEKLKNMSFSEKSFRALLDEEKEKIKDATSGENFLEAPEEGEFDLPFRSLPPEKSSILNEDTIPVNLGTEDNPQITYIATTLSLEEQKAMTEFLKNGKVNFVWTYKDMPGLDTDLVVHHLIVDP